MKKFFLISHNEYAHGLKKALEMITGVHDNLYSYGLMPGEHPDTIIKKIEEDISEQDDVIILGDIAGGSMCNSALRLTQKPNVRLISGMNLPLAMEIILMQPNTTEEINHIINNARENMKLLELELATNSGEDEFFGD